MIGDVRESPRFEGLVELLSHFAVPLVRYFRVNQGEVRKVDDGNRTRGLGERCFCGAHDVNVHTLGLQMEMNEKLELDGPFCSRPKVRG